MSRPGSHNARLDRIERALAPSAAHAQLADEVTEKFEKLRDLLQLGEQATLADVVCAMEGEPPRCFPDADPFYVRWVAWVRWILRDHVHNPVCRPDRHPSNPVRSAP